MSTTATNGLEKNAVGTLASGEEGAVGEKIDGVGTAAAAASAAHGEGGREVASSSRGGVNGTTNTTTAADGLEEETCGVIASGLDPKIRALAAAAELNGTTAATSTALASEGDLPTKGEVGVGGVGGGIATGDRATLSATATDGLEEDASGAITGAKCTIASADDEPGRNGEVD